MERSSGQDRRHSDTTGASCTCARRSSWRDSILGMRPASFFLLAVVACGGGSAQTNTDPCVGATPDPSCRSGPPPLTLVWQDEFDGASGATFDHAKWAADTGGGGFGNQEREFYTTRMENAALDGNGHLVITAIAEPASTSYTCWYGTCRYTSTRLKTQGLFTWTHGRFE